MSNFIALVYATLKQEGIDTNNMDTDEAVAKFKELQKKDGGKEGEKMEVKMKKPESVADWLRLYRLYLSAFCSALNKTVFYFLERTYSLERRNTVHYFLDFQTVTPHTEREQS